MQGHLKTAIVNDLPRYVHLDARLPLLLDRVRAQGKGLFLMTNSGYGYTQSIMGYLFSVKVCTCTFMLTLAADHVTPATSLPAMSPPAMSPPAMSFPDSCLTGGQALEVVL